MVKEISVDTIWDILNKVPDPEIPAISIVELGIIRDVQSTENMFMITITPTYNGCPAISFIKEEIVRRLESQGIRKFKIEIALSPPWTTDWMSDEVKARLKEVGIAPPTDHVVCPQCDSSEVKVVSNFGSTACKALYKCLSCHEPFHHFKQF